MEYIDRVYGAVEINEPVILDLINSQSLQRLKDIDQAGYFEPHFPDSSRSRFEHSVGVYLLLKRYNAPLDEQIAGLIHDVSHSAFSHCVDYVLAAGDPTNQNHQDNIHKDFIRHSAIPSILQRYGFDLDRILDDKNFPLKETNLPDLCADRLDYSLRAAIAFKYLPDVEYFLNNLTAENGRWIFKDFDSAHAYAKLFSHLNTTYWSGLPTAIMFQTVSDYLRYALDRNYIVEADLYTTDTVVLAKISPHLKTDTELATLFARMNDPVQATIDPLHFDTHVVCKSRAVDPSCWHNDEIKKVSDLLPEWKNVLVQETKPKEYFLKFAK